MKPLHARYPFLQSARRAVEEADVDLAAAVAEDDPVVDRALARVEGALAEGSVGESHRRTRVELLSYPVARVLVSLVDEHILTRKYARAEARTAHERFAEEVRTETELRSTDAERLDLSDLLGEFDLTVRETPDGYRVGVADYLRYAADRRGDEWRLVNRDLANGEIPLTEDDLLVVLQQAVYHRVSDGLPLEVPTAIEAQLEAEVEQVREELADLDLTRDIDTVVPELFPPCMKHLLDRVQKGDHLEHHARFAIASFLTSIGMSTDDIVDLFQMNPGFGEEMTRYQVDHIRGDTGPTEYSTPACATMQSYGNCVNKDDICEDVINESHPLNYYDHRLEAADDDEFEDWRERQEESSKS